MLLRSAPPNQRGRSTNGALGLQPTEFEKP